MDREHALELVREYKRVILPMFADARVYLFGSCSRNTARPDSDIDVAVIVPRVEGDRLDMSAMLWLATLDVDTSIEPILMEECHPSPLYEEVVQYGIAV